jgi:folate-dependent phosphoribosylglycinamide formyltransferase PurN
VPISPDDSLDDLAARVHAAEHRLLVVTLADLCSSEHPLTPLTTEART